MANQSQQPPQQQQQQQQQPNMVAVGQQFVKYYYSKFDADRKQLLSLYQSTSKLTFEGESFVGAVNIVNKLCLLKFTKVTHIPKTIDCQPSGCNNGVLVFCCGDLKIDDSENPIKFSQIFHLIPTDTKLSSFWVHNDIFRLNYG